MFLPFFHLPSALLHTGFNKKSPASSAEIPRTNSAASQTQPPLNDRTNSASAKTPMYFYEIINVWKHDPSAFTQGLVYLNGALLESTGMNGQSSLRQVDL